jgi:hypothetical protein
VFELLAASGYHGDNGGFVGVIIGIVSIAAVWFAIVFIGRVMGNAARRVAGPRKDYGPQHYDK